MKNFKPRTYTQKIKLRIKMSYFLLVLMLIYMVFMGELGGDSRIMTNLANIISDFIFFGGIALDLLLIFQLFITVTTALLNMPAFYTSLTLLLITLFLKAGLYLFYSYFK